MYSAVSLTLVREQRYIKIIDDDDDDDDDYVSTYCTGKRGHNSCPCLCVVKTKQKQKHGDKTHGELGDDVEYQGKTTQVHSQPATAEALFHVLR